MSITDRNKIDEHLASLGTILKEAVKDGIPAPKPGAGAIEVLATEMANTVVNAAVDGGLFLVGTFFKDINRIADTMESRSPVRVQIEDKPAGSDGGSGPWAGTRGG